MIDKEKVIKGLNDIGGFVAGRIGIEQARNFIRTIDDACDLLKEQEAVEPRTENDGVPEPGTAWWYVCGNCGREIDCYDKFCKHCGRAVKWE